MRVCWQVCRWPNARWTLSSTLFHFAMPACSSASSVSTTEISACRNLRVITSGVENRNYEFFGRSPRINFVNYDRSDEIWISSCSSRSSKIVSPIRLSRGLVYVKLKIFVVSLRLLFPISQTLKVKSLISQFSFPSINRMKNKFEERRMVSISLGN